jgi:hypothetical protein
VALVAVQLVKALGGGWQTVNTALLPARLAATTADAASPSIKP